MEVLKKIKTIAIGALMVGATIAFAGCSPIVNVDGKQMGVDDVSEYVEQLKAEQYNAGIDSVDITEDNALAIQSAIDAYESAKLEGKDVELAGKDSEISDKEAEIEQLKRDLQVYKDAEEAQLVVEAQDLAGYELDEQLFETTINKLIKHRQLDKLQDTEIEFDDEDYDIHEEISIGGNIVVSGNSGEEDMELNPFYTVKEGELSYSYVFDDQINATLITDKEPLKINFLGKDMSIISVDSNSITLRDGTKDILAEGASKIYTINGKDYEVKVEYIGKDSVKFSVNGEVSDTLEADDDYTFEDDVKIGVSEVLSQNLAGETDNVEFYIGTDVNKKIYVGEEFIEDQDEWILTKEQNGDNLKSIGISYNVDRTSIDEDEDFLAIGIGDSINLPYDYAKTIFDSVSTEKEITYDFKAKTDYVKVTANDKDGFIDANGDNYDEIKIYKVDRIEAEINGKWEKISDQVKLGDSNVTIGKDMMLINNIDKPMNITAISDQDKNVLTKYGLKIKSHDSWEEDGRVTITVPENQIEATIKVA